MTTTRLHTNIEPDLHPTFVLRNKESDDIQGPTLNTVDFLDRSLLASFLGLILHPRTSLKAIVNSEEILGLASRHRSLTSESGA